MDTVQVVVKHCLTGAALGAAYGCVKAVLQPSKPSHVFATQYPNLSADRQLASVLQRFQRLRDIDANAYDNALECGEQLMLLAANASGGLRGEQIVANRHAAEIVRTCKKLCAQGSAVKDEEMQRDAMALTMELDFLSQLCGNHVHNMMV